MFTFKFSFGSCFDKFSEQFVNFRKFDDGFPDIFIPNAHGIRGQHVAFLASFTSPGVIFEQLSVIYALPKLFISSFTLVLPFFPTGTSERMEDEGDVATAFTLARTLSNIPISRGGPTSLVTFDIHALQVHAYCLEILSIIMLFSLFFFFFFSMKIFSPFLLTCVVTSRRDSTLVIIFYHASRAGYLCSKIDSNSSLILTM